MARVISKNQVSELGPSWPSCSIITRLCLKVSCERFYFITTQSRLLTTLPKEPFQIIVGKGEIAGDQHFLLFPQCVLPYQRQNLLLIHMHFFFCKSFNPLPDNKILDWSKLKAFADDKLNVTQNIKVVFHRIENIVGKEENAGYQHFLLFPQCFREAFPPVCRKL